jgi:hypothetical protein
MAAAALVATTLMAGTATAASPLTLKCIRVENQKLRNTIKTARDTFKAARAECFGTAGLSCALTCTQKNDECVLENVTKPQALCNDVCADAQRDAVDICRSKFDNGELNEDQFDQCVNAARLLNLDCRLACTDQIDNARLACSQGQTGCLASCASCSDPDDCRPQP